MWRTWHALVLLPLVATGGAAADLESETVAAYEKYIAGATRDFATTYEDAGARHTEWTSPQLRARLRAGEVVARPGHGDGIVKVPDGLIHHWRAAIFIPEETLASVLAVVQDYGSYADVYDWVIDSARLRDVREPDRDRYRALLRIKRKAGMVSSTVDLWTAIEYRQVRPDLVTAVSNADCIRQVEDAGERDERRLPVGQGSGYLWRADTFTSYYEHDGGVYVDLQTLGLSRGYPPLLGWIIEPIARRLGRGSAADGLERLREVVKRPDGDKPSAGTPRWTSRLTTGWCGDADNPIPN
jgi:hypothetical protein